MKLFDSHCHLDDRAYRQDLNQVLTRARQAGVKAMMVVGVSRGSSQRAAQMAADHQEIYAAVGVHPHDVSQCSGSDLDTLKSLASQPKVRAWGEIGLDFNRMYSPRRDQEKWLVRQLEVACPLELPVIFHERDSGGRFLDILRQEIRPASGVIHCFSGSEAELKGYLDLGFSVGITGILTHKTRGAGLRRLSTLIPVERILIETDAPYLTPAPEKNRIRRNEPAFVLSVLLKLAEIRRQEPAALAGILWDNTCRLFGIDPNTG